MVECLTRDRRAVGSSLTGVTASWSLSKTHPSLVLVQSRKTCPFITEILLMVHKESNKQTNKQMFKLVDKKLTFLLQYLLFIWTYMYGHWITIETLSLSTTTHFSQRNCYNWGYESLPTLRRCQPIKA